MRIIYGDIFQAKVDLLVNPVNCEGVAGKGLAKQFKERFPRNFKNYRTLCLEGKIRPGHPYLFYDPKNPPLILNFPTKDKWRNPSKLEYIEEGLKSLRTIIQHLKIKSVALPALGCGLGGLNWEDVFPLIQKYLGDLPCKIEIYLLPEQKNVV